MLRTEKTINGVKIIAERFEGINDFLKEYESAPVSKEYTGHDTATELQNITYSASRKRFAGVKGYAEAVKQLKNGVNVTAIKAARTAATSGTKRKIKKSVNGGRVSVPSYLSGSPACMRRTVKAPAKTGLNIIVDTGVHCGVTADEITEAGKLIVKYVTELEQSYNVNLHAVVSVSMNKKKRKADEFSDAYICGIKIKDAGKPFSAARVSFCLTSAAFLRVFGFLWITRAEGVPYDYGLGRPTSNNSEQEKEILNAVYKNAVLVSLADVVRHGENGLPAVKEIQAEGASLPPPDGPYYHRTLHHVKHIQKKEIKEHEKRFDNALRPQGLRHF